MKQLKIKSIKKKQVFLEFLLLFMLIGGIFLVSDQVFVDNSKQDNLRKTENKIHNDQYYIDCLEKLTNRPVGSGTEYGNLSYSTYVGGNWYDYGYSIAIDADGCAYIVGRTMSQNFPTTTGAFDETHNGGIQDVFVCKLNANGSNLEYSTFIGGSSDDEGYSIAVDADGCAYIVGLTKSSDFNITTGAFDETYNGGNYDVFVSKLNPDGSDLVYSTFIGGSLNDYGSSVAIDTDGCAYITGYTGSTDFNITTGAFDETYNGGNYDTFVCKLSADGSDLIYSTFIGGTDYDYGNSIAIDADGNAYITGETESSDFNITTGAFDETYNGGTNDVFVSKLNADGSDLIYSTFIGGIYYENANSIALAIDGCAYITGYTGSTDFNITTDAFDETYNGGANDVFVSKLSADGSNLIYSTFIGGNDAEEGYSIAIAPDDSIYITGFSQSTNFPTTSDAFDETLNGINDVFFCKLSSDGSSLVYSTFIGGDSGDRGRSIVIGADGTAYIMGYSYSTNFNTTADVFDETYNGGTTDTFVCKFNIFLDGGSGGGGDDDGDDDSDNGQDSIPSFPLYLLIGISGIVIFFIIARNKTKRRYIYK